MKMDRRIRSGISTLHCCMQVFKEFVYLGALITDRNDIKSELNKRAGPVNACCYLVIKLLAMRLLSKKTKLVIYQSIIKYMGVRHGLSLKRIITGLKFMRIEF
jgi:hypothetical protein